MNETARAGYFGEAADASLTLPSAAASCLGRYLPSERTVDGVWYQMAESDLRMLADQLDSAGFIDEAARAAELAESAGFGDTFLVFLEA